MSNIGGEVDVTMAEVNTSALDDKGTDRGGDPSLVHEERLDASPATSAHVVLNQHEQPPAAEDDEPETAAHLPTIFEAELVRRRQEVEAALMSPALLPVQRAIFHAISSRFWFLEAGMMDMFLGFAKDTEVRSLFSLPLVSVLSILIYPVALRVSTGFSDLRTLC